MDELRRSHFQDDETITTLRRIETVDVHLLQIFFYYRPAYVCSFPDATVEESALLERFARNAACERLYASRVSFAKEGRENVSAQSTSVFSIRGRSVGAAKSLSLIHI